MLIIGTVNDEKLLCTNFPGDLRVKETTRNKKQKTKVFDV